MYCRGNPIKWADPTGYEPQSPDERTPLSELEPPPEELRKAAEGIGEFCIPIQLTPTESPFDERTMILLFTQMEEHHLLPKEFKDYFKRAGFDIEEPKFKIQLEKGKHRLKASEGIHTGKESWNKQWGEFWEKDPGAKKEAVMKQLKNMRKFFKI